jgi:hypothetical protein
VTPDLSSLAPPSTQTVIVAERAQFGVASAPFDLRTLSEAKGQAFSFTSDAWYELRAETWIGLRLPLVAASVRQPAGSYLDEAAWGNLELRFAQRFTLMQERARALRLTLGGGIGIPLAEHDSSLMPNRALAIANAAQGFAEPELFTPGELPFTPFAQTDFTSGHFRALALLKLPVLLRVSDADLPPTQSNPHRLALTPVLQIEARYSLSRHFGVAFAPQLTLDALPPSEHLRHVPALQLLVRAGPYFELGNRGTLALDLQAPIAGSLGGSTVALGVRSAIRF